MNTKQITITTINPLNKTKNAAGIESNERFSLKEGRSGHFAVYTLEQGETVVKNAAGEITQVGKIKIGDKIVAVERDINLSDGTTTKGWYYLNSGNIQDWAATEVERDGQHAINIAKKRQLMQLAREFQGTNLEELMKTA